MRKNYPSDLGRTRSDGKIKGRPKRAGNRRGPPGNDALVRISHWRRPGQRIFPRLAFFRVRTACHTTSVLCVVVGGDDSAAQAAAESSFPWHQAAAPSLGTRG